MITTPEELSERPHSVHTISTSPSHALHLFVMRPASTRADTRHLATWASECPVGGVRPGLSYWARSASQLGEIMAIGIYFNPASANAAQYGETTKPARCRCRQAQPDAPIAPAPAPVTSCGYSASENRSRRSAGRFGENLMPILRQSGLGPGQLMAAPGHNFIPG